MSASTQASAQVLKDHQSYPRLRRCQSFTEWEKLPGLDMNLELWSTKDSLQLHGHKKYDPRVGKHGGAWSSTHIIPVPDFDHKPRGDDGCRNCDKRDAYHRGQGRESVVSPLTLSLTSLCPQAATSVQPNERRGASVGHSGPHTPFDLAMTKITSEHDVQDPEVDAIPDETVHSYTPQSLPISVASTPIWCTEFSSTTSTPVMSRRGSGTASPQTFMLQGFLAQHSNGHTLYHKPTNSSVDCLDCLRLSDSNNNDAEEMEELDDRFFLLAQSPDPSEFEYGDFFMTETQKNAHLHQADSPVFFNGFPLLRMTPMDRDG